MTRCKDKGVGSRGRKGNTCAGAIVTNRETGETFCEFHAKMRVFVEVYRDATDEARRSEDGS